MDTVDNFFINSRLLKLKLLNYIIEHPLEKLPTSKKLSFTYNISDITAKKIVAELAEKGYLKSNKKGGTKITNRFSKAQKRIFSQSKEEIKRTIKNLEENGLDPHEILACLYGSLLEYTFDNTEILYTEKDSELVFAGAREIGDRLNIKVKPVYFENIQQEITYDDKRTKAVIIPFYCYHHIDSMRSYTKVFPIQTTHPLEYLSNSKNIAYNSTVVYVAVSDEDKEAAFSLQHKIENETFRLKIYKIEELINNARLINSAELAVAYKWIINNNEKLFKNVPKVMSYNRFDDKEGLMMIKNFIDSNKLGG